MEVTPVTEIRLTDLARKKPNRVLLSLCGTRMVTPEKTLKNILFPFYFPDLNITVDVISGNTKALPMATTCGQRMSIPLYPSKKILKRKLLQAIQCQGYGLG